MNRRLFPFLLALLVLTPAVFFGARYLSEKTTRIPEKRLWIQTLDTSNFYKTPSGAPVGFPTKNRGTATIACKNFLLRFEGETFLEGGFSGGGYTVDGRYGGLFPPDSEPLSVQENNGVTYSYDASTRILTITYQSHRLFYRHFENTLEIGGRKYPTVPDFLVLSIAKNGRVQKLKLPPEIDIASIIDSSSTYNNWPVAPRK